MFNLRNCQHPWRKITTEKIGLAHDKVGSSIYLDTCAGCHHLRGRLHSYNRELLPHAATGWLKTSPEAVVELLLKERQAYV